MNLMLNILVADDEHIARSIVLLLLQNQPDVGEVYEAKDGNEALLIAQEHTPDIVFLDIHMPGQSGIELAEKLPSNTVVVFITAYDNYALNAFELSAVDYLLKPFEDERFYDALERARKQVKDKRVGYHGDIRKLLEYSLVEKQNKFKSRLIVKEPGRIRLLDVKEINFILSAGNYAEVHLFGGNVVLHRETMTSLESQLDPGVFARIHRSTIVRRKSIAELRPSNKGDYLVFLKSGEELTLSRRNKANLKDLFE